MKRQKDFTGLLFELRKGSREAYDKAFILVYDELHDLAGQQLGHCNAEASILPCSKTDIVHETYLKLMANPPKLYLVNRAHFCRIAARCMRSIIIDHIRKKTAGKRGGKQQPVTLIEHIVCLNDEGTDYLEIDMALKKLNKWNGRLAKLVELRYFLGLNLEETAIILKVSLSTVKRDWVKARGWLSKELNVS